MRTIPYRCLAVAAVLAILAGCGPAARQSATAPTASGPAGDNPWPEGRSFVSTGVIEAGADRPLVAGTRILVRFRQAGEFVVQAGCNELNVKATVEGDRITPIEYLSTALGCDPTRLAQDQWLVAFFNANPTYAVTGDVLVLRAADREIRLLDQKVADRPHPLIGTRWVVTGTLSADGTAASVPAGVALLVFSATTVIGETGCSGVATEVAYPDGVPTTTGRITIGPVHRSSVPCEGAVQQLDTAVMAALQGTVTARLDGPGLALTSPSGAGLTLRADDTPR